MPSCFYYLFRRRARSIVNCFYFFLLIAAIALFFFPDEKLIRALRGFKANHLRKLKQRLENAKSQSQAVVAVKAPELPVVKPVPVLINKQPPPPPVVIQNPPPPPPPVVQSPPAVHPPSPLVIYPSDQASGTDASKREKIVEMIRHAWGGYEKFAWGKNEVRPVSKTADQSDQTPSMGMTIFDSIDTLHIAGLTAEFQKAKNWIQTEFKFEGQNDVSVFDVNVRIVGSLLSLHSLTNDDSFLKQASTAVQKLLPAFGTKSGIPLSLVNLRTSKASSWSWVPEGCAILSEFGGLSMEFLYLAKKANDNTFRDKVLNIYKGLKQAPKIHGLYNSYYDPESGQPCKQEVSVGAMGDSFYEYLFKAWLLSSAKEGDLKTTYDSAIEAIFSNLMKTSSLGRRYFAIMYGQSPVARMDHMGCFMGGLLGLSAKHSSNAAQYLDVANAIGESCHAAYSSSKTGLGPEGFFFGTSYDAVAAHSGDKKYLLRPEVVETYFYMWRITHDPKWRRYGWDAAQAIDKYCRTEGGFSGVENVYEEPVKLDDHQPSYFLGETLKYLYLLFSADDVMPLDQFVFNRGGHPLRIFN